MSNLVLKIQFKNIFLKCFFSWNINSYKKISVKSLHFVARKPLKVRRSRSDSGTNPFPDCGLAETATNQMCAEALRLWNLVNRDWINSVQNAVWKIIIILQVGLLYWHVFKAWWANFTLIQLQKQNNASTIPKTNPYDRNITP